eukprot:UN11309
MYQLLLQCFGDMPGKNEISYEIVKYLTNKSNSFKFKEEIVLNYQFNRCLFKTDITSKSVKVYETDSNIKDIKRFCGVTDDYILHGGGKRADFGQP